MAKRLKTTTPTWYPVISSNIEAVGYNADKKILYVKFLSGKSYTYQKVSKDLYNNLLEAESVGSFFAKEIKPNYKAEIFEDI